MKKDITFRIDGIVDLCRGKEVLHLGFIQHSHLYEKLIGSGDWLHGQLNSVAKRLVGIDYLAKDVDIIRRKYGYECYAGDVTKLDELDFQGKFDVVVCGELIEHLENPGLMLESIKRFMRPDSTLVVTTPNPWSTQRIQLINSGVLEDAWLNDEHVGWYTFGTLKQMLERKGYSEIRYGYYFHQKREILHHTPARFLKRVRIAKKIFLASRIPEQNYEGLFFLARLK